MFFSSSCYLKQLPPSSQTTVDNGIPAEKNSGTQGVLQSLHNVTPHKIWGSAKNVKKQLVCCALKEEPRRGRRASWAASGRWSWTGRRSIWRSVQRSRPVSAPDVRATAAATGTCVRTRVSAKTSITALSATVAPRHTPAPSATKVRKVSAVFSAVFYRTYL